MFDIKYTSKYVCFFLLFNLPSIIEPELRFFIWKHGRVRNKIKYKNFLWILTRIYSINPFSSFNNLITARKWKHKLVLIPGQPTNVIKQIGGILKCFNDAHVFNFKIRRMKIQLCAYGSEKSIFITKFSPMEP